VGQAPEQEARGRQSAATSGDITSGAAHGAAAVLQQAASETAEVALISSTDRMARLGRAVHGAANEIGRELPPMGDYMHSAADRLEGLASGLRGKSIEDLVSSLSGFVRREPGIAFAGLVFAGLVVTRLVSTSH